MGVFAKGMKGIYSNTHNHTPEKSPEKDQSSTVGLRAALMELGPVRVLFDIWTAQKARREELGLCRVGASNWQLWQFMPRVLL